MHLQSDKLTVLFALLSSRMPISDVRRWIVLSTALNSSKLRLSIDSKILAAFDVCDSVNV